MFFDNIHGLVRVAAFALAAYIWLIVVLRLAGKRSLSKLNAFDLVVTVALGSTFATVLLSKDVAFLEGALAFSALAGLQWLVTWLSVRWRRFGRLVRSYPRLLFENGLFRTAAMKDERVTQAEIAAAIRASGIGRFEDVGAVVLETDGSMTVLRRCDSELTLLENVRR